MNTCMPGKIVAFDGVMATVRPAMPMTLANGESLDAPEIVSVPVCFPVGMGGDAQVTVPLQAGDDCLLFFSQRSVENWLSGSDQAPDDPRQHDLTDAFCAPLLRPGRGAVDTENVTLQYGGGTLKLASDGSLTIDVPQMTVNAPETEFNGNVSVNGAISFTDGMTGTGSGLAITGGSVTHNGTNIGADHRHSGVETGGGNTGGPV